MTKNEFDMAVELLGAFWPKQKLTKKQCAAWWLALEPYPYQDGVRDNIIRYARSDKGNFFPEVADLTRGLSVTTGGDDDWSWLDAYLDDTYVSNPVTRYAAAHGGTVGEAEAALGITWAEAQEGRRKP